MSSHVRVKWFFLLTGSIYCIASVAKPLVESELNLLQSWSSNSLLSVNEQAKNDLITEIKPKVKIISNQAAMNFINYQIQAMHYINNTKPDHIFHQGQFKGSYNPIPKKMNLTLLGDYTQQILDPVSQYQRENRVGSRLPDALTMSLIPSYYDEKGPNFTQISLNHSYAQFFHANQPDTLDANYTILHRKKRKIGPPSYEITAHWRQTRAGQVNTSLKKDLQGNLSFPMMRTVWLLQEVGYEEIVDKIETVQKENGYSAKIGFGYFPTEYFYATFLAGQTPYGKQYESDISFHRGMTELKFSLNESVQNSIQAQIDVLPAVINPVISPNILTLQLPFMNDTFLSRKANLLLKRTLSVVMLSVKIAHTQEKTLHTQQTAQAHGIGGLLEWSFQKHHSLQLQGTYQKQQLLADIDQTQRLVIGAYHYQILPKQRFMLQLQHFNRQLPNRSKVTENQLGFNYALQF